MADGDKFTAAMVQMRTSLLPEPSLEQGIKLIRVVAELFCVSGSKHPRIVQEHRGAESHVDLCCCHDDVHRYRVGHTVNISDDGAAGIPLLFQKVEDCYTFAYLSAS